MSKQLTIQDKAALPVKLLSPFRYPGGKTWFVPYIRLWLANLPKRPHEFIEPFAGGSIASLTVASEELANHVTLVELDEDVAAVWQVILTEDEKWLANQVSNFDFTPETVAQVLSTPAHSLQDKAFKTILRNRINRSGILAPGAGKLKNGENGKGIKSRWYPKTLCGRILGIAKFRERITFIKGDGLEEIEKNAQNSQAVFFIDPPYSVGEKRSGTRLYKHFEIDHNKLFDLVSTITGQFLMTYNNDEKVRTLAQKHHLVFREILMKSSHHAQMTELVISRNLSWLD
jgi:DNA adenine methylase